jgi:hypothetical protein
MSNIFIRLVPVMFGKVLAARIWQVAKLLVG